jgi:regulatory protein
MDEPPSTAIVTGIRAIGHGRQRLITLNDGRELAVSSEACTRVPELTVGVEATGAILAALDAAEHRVLAHEAALRLLSNRARSQTEMRARLAMRGIEPAAIEDELVRLRNSGLLDDEKFARAWVEDRKRMAPRGRRMLRYELLGRGIEPQSVDVATNAIDDRETALEIARGRARGGVLESYETFLTKVGGFLRRRGFDHAVVVEVTRTVWTEVTGSPAELTSGELTSD